MLYSNIAVGISVLYAILTLLYTLRILQKCCKQNCTGNIFDIFLWPAILALLYTIKILHICYQNNWRGNICNISSIMHCGTLQKYYEGDYIGNIPVICNINSTIHHINIAWETLPLLMILALIHTIEILLKYSQSLY